jgi:hypothetical protein
MTNFTFEPELNRPTPRPVRYGDGCQTGCGIWFVRLFMLPHTLVGIGFLCAAIWFTSQFAAVGLFGTTCDGKVVKKDDTRRTKGARRYFVIYTYELNGQAHTSELLVDEQRFAEINEGDAITVRVWEATPDSGQWPRLPGYWPIGRVGGAWLVAVFWNSILSIFLWTFYVRPWRQRQLVRIGIPAEGIIRDVSTYVNKGTTTRCRRPMSIRHRCRSES